MSSLSIRYALLSDLPRLTAIYNMAIPAGLATADTEPVTVASRETWFAAYSPTRRPMFVGVDEHGVVQGFCGLRDYYGRPAYHITAECSVYLAPEAQGHGHAKALLRHTLKAAPKVGVHVILAQIFGHNAASIGLFKHFGFSLWGTLPAVCDMPQGLRDVVIYGRDLRAA